MWKELMYKWFGLEPFPCQVCEVLRDQLAKSEKERSELLTRLLVQPEPPSQIKEEEFKPVGNQYVPWRVRQQMFEAEDRKKAQLMREKQEEMAKISELEKDLGIVEVGNASQIS